MIASDNHLGYLENDQIRGDDSFNSFEEVLKISKSESVDFLLLGGDLFHHHNPSKKTIIRTGNKPRGTTRREGAIRTGRAGEDGAVAEDETRV